MTTNTIAILGAGNMGASLIGGLVANHYAPENIFVTDPDASKLADLKQKFHIQTTTDNTNAVQQADIVILAVKPQIIISVTQEIAAVAQQKKPLLISIAAGVREDSLQKTLGGNIPIVRCMPNTPALIGCGASALFANSFVASEQHKLAESIMSAVGVVVWLDNEKQMDAVTALSGSGPAYFFLIMEALQNAAQELGLPADTARLLTLQTALGAARMALESDESVVELRRRVTSPGGTTERALHVLEEGHIRQLLAKALNAAKNRSEELASIIG